MKTATPFALSAAKSPRTFSVTPPWACRLLAALVLGLCVAPHALDAQAWQGEDIGPTGIPGSHETTAGVTTVRGSGADIWGNSDAFHFNYCALAGDGEITARVSLAGTTNGGRPA